MQTGWSGFFDRLGRLNRAFCYLLAIGVGVAAYFAHVNGGFSADGAANVAAGIAAVLITIGHAFKWLLTGKA